ncbi:MAG: SCO family protein [Verrucomicrobiales bacterium]|nr:SCO family protein [Verrucomicrobiales bacterium]
MKNLFNLLIILLAGTSLGALAATRETSTDYDYPPPAPGTYTLPVIKRAADGALLDVTGQPVRLASLTRGRITLMSFIYTRCANTKACPYATGVLLQIHRASTDDPRLSSHLRLVSMSFDPAIDTPTRMADYANLFSRRAGAAPWHFVTARNQEDLQPVLDAYGQAVDRKENPADPTGPLNHTLRVFLVDAAGFIRNIYSSGTLDPRLVLADIQTLMLETSAKQSPDASPVLFMK